MKKSRKEYLKNLAEEMGISLETVMAMADMLGANEDEDGLITMLEDYAEYEDYFMS